MWSRECVVERSGVRITKSAVMNIKKWGSISDTVSSIYRHIANRREWVRDSIQEKYQKCENIVNEQSGVCVCVFRFTPKSLMGYFAFGQGGIQSKLAQNSPRGLFWTSFETDRLPPIIFLLQLSVVQVLMLMTSRYLINLVHSQSGCTNLSTVNLKTRVHNCAYNAQWWAQRVLWGLNS